MDIKNINWQKCGGLIPAITQDFETSEVLMLGYMSEESLDLSLKTGLAHYFSRSRNRIWQKGETSGNTQEIKAVSYTHLTLPTKLEWCRSRWSPYH